MIVLKGIEMNQKLFIFTKSNNLNEKSENNFQN